MSQLENRVTRCHRIDRDADTGKLQKLINDGYTIQQLANIYEVSDTKIKRMIKAGKISFKRSRGRRVHTTMVHEWSDMKKLAMCGKW